MYQLCGGILQKIGFVKDLSMYYLIVKIQFYKV